MNKKFFTEEERNQAKKRWNKKYNKKYNQNHREEKKLKGKEYYQTHKEEKLLYAKEYRKTHKKEINEYYQNHKEKIKLQRKGYEQIHKEEIKLQRKKYRQNHKNEKKIYDKKYQKIHKKQINNYKNNRLKTDIKFKLVCNLRSRLRKAIHKNYKSGSAIKDLGCSIPELKLYLESKFQEGMSWNNWSHTGWHIDHIKPLTSFNLQNRKEFLKACHYTNLQPLWAKINLKKGKNNV